MSGNEVKMVVKSSVCVCVNSMMRDTLSLVATTA